MKKKFTILLSLCFLIKTISAQLSYTPETSYNLAGSYNDLGTSGGVIPTANKDDANSVAYPIGFNFNYNGTNYSYFILNTNGFIKLGVNSSMSAPSAANLVYKYFNQNIPGGVLSSSNSLDANIISIFNHDLDSSTTLQTEYRYSTTGVIGSRITTIQYKNVTDKNISDTSSGSLPHVQFAGMDFQIKLYEANDMIEFIYGNFSPTSDTSLFKLAGIGLKGSSIAQMLTVTKTSSHEYHNAQFQSGNYLSGGVGSGFNFGNNNYSIGKAVPTCAVRPLPDQGRTFRFLPQISNDADIKIVYANHAIAIPWGLPRAISAKLTNVGTSSMTGIWVYLNITGANTYSDSVFYNTLGVGLSTTPKFTGYEPSVTGTDIITLSLSSDGENINNSLSWLQKVSNREQGFADSSGTFSNFGWSAGSGIFASKYHVNGKRRISKIYIKIGFNLANLGQSVHGVVVNSSSKIIGRSQTHIITCNDLDKWVELVITGGNTTSTTNPPPIISNADFYAGLAIPGSGYYPMSLQLEDPNRTGMYYYHGGITSTGTYTDITTISSLKRYRYGLNVKMDGVSLKLEPVTSLNDPSCALPNQTVEVTVTNHDSIMVDFSVDTLHLEVSSTGAITQSFSQLINSGTLLPDSSTSFVITNNFDLSVAGQYNIEIEARQWMEVDTSNNYRFLTVNVVDTPDVLLDVNPDSVICLGTPFTFIATPYTAGSILYQWKVNGVNQGSTTTDSSFTPSINYGDSVSVDLITNHCTTGTFTIPSNEIVMKLNPKPKLINSIADTDTVIEFTKRNYGIGIISGYTYLWKASGGTILTDSTGAAIQIDWDGPNTNAQVSVSETDDNNCTRINILPVVVISIVGIDKANSVGIGEAYPNPADQTVNIPVYANRESKIQLEIYDISGKKIMDLFNGVISGNRIFRIPVNDLNEGLYFYKIRTSDGFEKVNRLTIKH